jgi:hypothetical protein
MEHRIDEQKRKEWSLTQDPQDTGKIPGKSNAELLGVSQLEAFKEQQEGWVAEGQELDRGGGTVREELGSHGF